MQQMDHLKENHLNPSKVLEKLFFILSLLNEIKIKFDQKEKEYIIF